MRRMGFQHGGSALGLALLAHQMNKPPVEQTSARHRGREAKGLTAPTLNLAARRQGKTEIT